MSTTEPRRITQLLADSTDLSPVHEFVHEEGSPVAQDHERIRVSTARETGGKPLVASPELTAQERNMVERAVDAVRPQPKCCFANALRLCDYNSAFTYVEGFAVADEWDYLYEHAWNLLNGKIVDVTAGDAPFTDYYGVVIDNPELLKHYYELGVDRDIWSVIGNHGDHFHYLRDRGYLQN